MALYIYIYIPFAKLIAVKNGTNGAFLLFGLILTSCYLDVLLSCLEKGGMKMSPGIEWEEERWKIFFMGNNPLLPL